MQKYVINYYILICVVIYFNFIYEKKNSKLTSNTANTKSGISMEPSTSTSTTDSPGSLFNLKIIGFEL